MNEQSTLFDSENLDRDSFERKSFTPRRSKKTCAFCGIIRKEIPAREVMRTDRIVAFLDQRPLFAGHVLMIPIVHVSTYDQIPEDLAHEWLLQSQNLQRAIESAMNCDGSLMIVNNVVSQSVPHLHLHIIPRGKKDGLRLWLGPRHPYVTDEEAERVAAKIRNALIVD